MELTDLHKRVLAAALAANGRLIFWVLGGGRWMLPGFAEDVSGTLRDLESGGLLAPPDGTRHPTGTRSEPAKGSHVVALTEPGRHRALSATGRQASASPKGA